MRFTSIEYWFFLVVVFLLYYAINPKYRWSLLLFGSYFFYTYWEPIYGIVLLFSTLIDYLAAIQISKRKKKAERRFFLGLSLLSNLGLLIFFKLSETISGFVSINYNLFTHTQESTALNLLIPIGVSFYTFQTLSYTIDVYKNRTKPELHFGYFALYVSFFPQLIAGPIERSTSLLPQLRQKVTFNYADFIAGGKLIVWGIFKKLLIADILVQYSDQVYDQIDEKNGITSLIGVVLFTLYIYVDFSAYTDIALGSARLFGIRLMANFDRPFLSKTVSEFWSKWHISLTSWIFDYMLKPLSRTTKIDWRLNILICFFIIGIWHGISIGYIVFGVLNGVLYIISRYTLKRIKVSKSRKFYAKLVGVSQIVFVSILMGSTTVFFRSSNLYQAKKVFQNILFGGYEQVQLFFKTGDVVILALSLLVFYVVQLSRGFSPVSPFQGIKNPVLRNGIYYLMIVMLMAFGYNTKQEFIYFQF